MGGSHHTTGLRMYPVRTPRAGQHRCLKAARAATLIQKPRSGGRNDTLCPGAASGIVGDPTAATQNCLNQRQEVRKGWLLLPGLPDGQTHLGWRPLVMEAASPGKTHPYSPIRLPLLLMGRNVIDITPL